MARTSFQLICAMCSEGCQRFRGSFCCSASEQHVWLFGTNGCSFEGETSLKLEEAPATVVPLFCFVCFICGEQGCKGSQACVSFGIFPLFPMEAPSVQSSSITHSKEQGPRREQQQSLKNQASLNAFAKHHPSLLLPEAVGFLGNYSNANRQWDWSIRLSFVQICWCPVLSIR